MMFDPRVTWGDVQEDIESIENFFLDEDGKFLGRTPDEIMKEDSKTSVFGVMDEADDSE